MKKNTIAITFMFLMLTLFSCSSKSSITVEFIGADDKEIVSSKLNTDKENTNALEAFRAIASHNDIEFKESDGFVTSINKIENGTNDGWCFFVNDKAAEVGAKDYIPQKNDKISFKFVNYAEIFPEIETEDSVIDSSKSQLVFGTYLSTVWYNPDEELCFKLDKDHVTAYNKSQPDTTEVNDYILKKEYFEVTKEETTFEIGYNKDVLYYPGYSFEAEIPEGNSFKLEGVVSGYDYFKFFEDNTLEFGVVSPSGFYETYCKGTYVREGNIVKCDLVSEEYYKTAKEYYLYLDSENKQVLTWIFVKID